jgi:hypothetical protein
MAMLLDMQTKALEHLCIPSLLAALPMLTAEAECLCSLYMMLDCWTYCNPVLSCLLLRLFPFPQPCTRLLGGCIWVLGVGREGGTPTYDLPSIYIKRSAFTSMSALQPAPAPAPCDAKQNAGSGS